MGKSLKIRLLLLLSLVTSITINWAGTGRTKKSGTQPIPAATAIDMVVKISTMVVKMPTMVVNMPTMVVKMPTMVVKMPTISTMAMAMASSETGHSVPRAERYSGLPLCKLNHTAVSAM